MLENVPLRSLNGRVLDRGFKFGALGVRSGSRSMDRNRSARDFRPPKHGKLQDVYTGLGFRGLGFRV